MRRAPRGSVHQPVSGEREREREEAKGGREGEGERRKGRERLSDSHRFREVLWISV